MGTGQGSRRRGRSDKERTDGNSDKDRPPCNRQYLHAAASFCSTGEGHSSENYFMGRNVLKRFFFLKLKNQRK